MRSLFSKSGLLGRFRKSKDGSAAIEFAILVLPYFMIIFAIIETFVAATGEQLVSNAVDTLSRKLRTGQITVGMNRSTDMSKEEFRQAFCSEVSILITCDASEIKTPQKLYIDLRAFSNFGLIPKDIPRQSAAKYADIDTSSFGFAPGGPGSINMLRAFYRWQITTDIVRPYITTIRPADGSMPTDFLIFATTAFQTENFL
jgi:Flp pilus assembly protein TadG